MKQPYPGIDYSGPGSTNRDVTTGIRYGVISQNSVMPEALDDVEYDYGVPDEAECPECGTRCEVPDNWGDSTHCPNCDALFEVEMPDCIEPCGWTYERYGYKLCDCLDNDIFVIESPYLTYAQFCSPCVPGAGNLDSPMDGGVKTYCLGHEFFDKENPCPYPVFDVKTGKLVPKPE